MEAVKDETTLERELKALSAALIILSEQIEGVLDELDRYAKRDRGTRDPEDAAA